MSFYYVKNLLYLVGEQGNGGSSQVFHRSVHETLGGAKYTAEDMITAQDIAGVDAENK